MADAWTLFLLAPATLAIPILTIKLVIGAKKPMISQTPPFNAKTKDEENFIQYVANHQNTHIITCTGINDVASQTENSSSNQSQRMAPNTKCISHDGGPLHKKRNGQYDWEMMVETGERGPSVQALNARRMEL